MPITQAQAEHYARLPLANLSREYPNHVMHLLNGPHDVRSPRQLHPIFYGCYDWHSAVHGWWLLARCAAHFPQLSHTAQIHALFEQHFTEELGRREADYFLQPGRAPYERPYGWAWLLKLAAELHHWSAPQAAAWRAALQPLVSTLRQRLIDFLPRQTYPIRTGTHYNTAFALLLALDFARDEGDAALYSTLQEAALRYYAADTDYPSHYEPGGDDFLSGALTESALMSTVLPQQEFAAWLDRFLPDLAGTRHAALLAPVTVADRGDPKTVHLDGLHLSRAWCLRTIAQVLPPTHPAQTRIRDAASSLAAASLPHVDSGDYGGEHWLATFALLALEAG